MSSHIATRYLNSCLKVPIDPGNNRPSPVFSRPNMCLGSLSVKASSPQTAGISKHCNETAIEQKWSCSGIRSLAKLYNSIPDYRDLHHLSGEEFYSTLNTLRSTCQKLKIKTNCCSSEDRCSTTTTTSLSSTSPNCQPKRSRSKKSKKSKKKKSIAEKCEESRFTPKCLATEKQQNLDKSSESDVGKNSFSKSSKNYVGQEVENFKKSLQEFEVKFKRPLTSLNHNEAPHPKEFAHAVQEHDSKSNVIVPTRSNFTTTLRERLRKSLSFNDLRSSTEPPELAELRKKNKTLEILSFKGESNNFKNSRKLSTYFPENSKQKTTPIPKIIVDSPNTEKLYQDNLPGEVKSIQKRLKNEEYKMPFKLFELDTSKKPGSIKHSTPSPVHPVARPNLAATLRAESSKRKVNELKNSCTFLDTNAQFDWEVRKTPAWKTLSLNETHKQILQLRLATRKVEQALQQREYELNMELMRQRVKSTPLLLEGPTHWGPHVGKLSHGCQKEGRRHMCQANLQRSRRRKNPSRGNCCRRKMAFSTSSALEEENFDNSPNTFRVQTGSSNTTSNKINTLRKIYGRSSTGAKTQSRNSNYSTNTQKYLTDKRKTSSNITENHKIPLKNAARYEAVEIDSGEELSSLDRAFL